MGFAEALARFQAVIEGCGGSWTRSLQRLSQVQDPAAQGVVERRFWLDAASARSRIGFPVHGSLVDHRHEVSVELSRHWSGADQLAGDYYAVMRELATQARVVEHSLMHPANWKYTTTGIVLVNHLGSSLSVVRRPMIVWQIDLEVTIRVASAAVIVA